jgi:hypothetical protein
MAKVFSISGSIGSGKDTIADYLVTFHGFKRLSFASSLKDAVSSVFGWDRTLLEGSTKHSRQWREQVDEWWADRLNTPNLTPRWVLQYWGTDLLRTHFHDEIWIASIENKLRHSVDDIVITDCRFKNEIDAVKRIGGVTLRANRGPRPDWYTIAEQYNSPTSNFKNQLRHLLEGQGVHASEYSSVGLDYDHHIDNNGTITELHAQIEKILERI